MANMGLGVLGSSNICYKRKYRWMFSVSAIMGNGVSLLPPSRSARPNLSFKEMSVEHLNETIYAPGKPDWKPINVSLYDIVLGNSKPHLIFQWLQTFYNPCKKVAGSNTGTYTLPVGSGFILDAYLDLYDGCGNVIESWVYKEAWPQSVEFGELDMGNSEVLTCDLTLRYNRAYITTQCS